MMTVPLYGLTEEIESVARGKKIGATMPGVLAKGFESKCFLNDGGHLKRSRFGRLQIDQRYQTVRTGIPLQLSIHS